MRISVIITLIGLLASTMVQSGCADPENPPLPSVPIVLGKATTADVPVYRTYPGKTQAVRTMGIHARVEGILEQLHFLQGGLVEPGQLLFTLQQEPFTAERDSARAEVAAAVADAAYARSQVERNQGLVEQGAVSREYFDQLRAKLVAAEARVETAKAHLVEADLNLSYCSVTLPEVPREHLYRIGRTFFDEGSLVGPGRQSELATVVQISPIRAVFDPAGAEWPEYLRQSRGGEERLEVLVTVPTDSSYAQKGRVNFVDNIVDARTSTVEMWAEIDNRDLALMPGQYISCRVQLDLLKNAVVVPSVAIQSSSSKRFIWTMKDGKPAQATLKLGPELGDQVAVLDGLKAGDTIVIDGGNKIRPGATLKVVSPEEMKKLQDAPPNTPPATKGS